MAAVISRNADDRLESLGADAMWTQRVASVLSRAGALGSRHIFTKAKASFVAGAICAMPVLTGEVSAKSLPVSAVRIQVVRTQRAGSDVRRTLRFSVHPRRTFSSTSLSPPRTRTPSSTSTPPKTFCRCSASSRLRSTLSSRA